MGKEADKIAARGPPGGVPGGGGGGKGEGGGGDGGGGEGGWLPAAPVVQN